MDVPYGIGRSMSRSGNVWDNAAMESFFSSFKTEGTARQAYRTRDQAKADVFDYIECFYNLEAEAFEARISQPDRVRKAGWSNLSTCIQTGCRPLP